MSYHQAPHKRLKKLSDFRKISRKVNKALSAVILLTKLFPSSELVSDPPASGNSGSKVMISEFETLDLEGK